MNRRTAILYLSLLLVLGVIVVWQSVEHARVREATRTQVINRARDISSTMALVMRSQRRFGVISRERMESALEELVRPGTVDALALVNADGEVVASAGEDEELILFGSDVAKAGVHWGEDTITVVNLVDLGTNVTQEAETRPPTIILPRDQFPTNFLPPPPRSPERDTNLISSVEGTQPPPPGTNFSRFGFRGRGPRPPGEGSRGPDGRGPDGGTNSPSFSRPFWMSQADYQAAIKRAGAHNIVILMSAEAVRASLRNDLWMRSLVCLLAAAAAGLAAFSWRNLNQTHDLQLRLVKASEMNTHLKQLNLAAAGLAHETRNPLNIIRGLAQLISRQGDSGSATSEKARAIVEETDRLTAQLNEFINYSRPREVRRAPVPLGKVAGEVARALGYDAEEKHAAVAVTGVDLTVEADEQLLRQTLFNLLLNAIQAVDNGGKIEIAILARNGAGAALEVRDNGPGVPPENRAEIFKPYFTTNEHGTGLGLAVVQQIVAAHGWEVEYADNTPRGAVFRIRGLKVAARN